MGCGTKSDADRPEYPDLSEGQVCAAKNGVSGPVRHFLAVSYITPAIRRIFRPNSCRNSFAESESGIENRFQFASQPNENETPALQ